jgi:RimJ/RimL family protein N-acetyltransferase
MLRQILLSRTPKLEHFLRGPQSRSTNLPARSPHWGPDHRKEDRILTTERLILRRWRDSDRQPFAGMNADSRVMEFFAALLSRKESDSMVDKIESHFAEHGFGLCAAELRQEGTFIGFIGIAVPDFDAPFAVELGWRLAADYWGHGLATEGARAIVRHGFETLGLDEIVATTVPANARSRRVMEKLGMTHNAADDFDHPLLPKGHPLRRHVLYRLRRPD